MDILIISSSASADGHKVTVGLYLSWLWSV